MCVSSFFFFYSRAFFMSPFTAYIEIGQRQVRAASSENTKVFGFMSKT